MPAFLYNYIFLKYICIIYILKNLRALSHSPRINARPVLVLHECTVPHEWVGGGPKYIYNLLKKTYVPLPLCILGTHQRAIPVGAKLTALRAGRSL